MAVSTSEWLAAAWAPPVRNRALKVALIVGTLLVLINQSDRLFAGELTLAVLFKMLLTYCVPYAVSTYAGVSATLDGRQTDDA